MSGAGKGGGGPRRRVRPPADPAWFGERLLEERRKAGWTRPELERASGVGASCIRDLENGRRRPTWMTALALAEALSLSLEEFARAPDGDARPPLAGRQRLRSWANLREAIARARIRRGGTADGGPSQGQ